MGAPDRRKKERGAEHVHTEKASGVDVHVVLRVYVFKTRQKRAGARERNAATRVETARRGGRDG